MPDFTIRRYIELLEALQKKGFAFQTFLYFLNDPLPRSIILRHDVDRMPENSLRFARIQRERGIRGTYYFRIVGESFYPGIIREIAGMGHEIGYHYEDLDLARKYLKKHPGGSKSDISYLIQTGIKLFAQHLSLLREIAPVATICMHGSPLSPIDNRLLWKEYDYRDYGIAGEPYFDTDFSNILYLTDTGRRWDGDRFNVRDTVAGLPHTTNVEPLSTRYRFHSTRDIVRAVQSGLLPRRVMLTFHPQRWTGRPLPWLKELVWQGMKNQVKYFRVRSLYNDRKA